MAEAKRLYPHVSLVVPPTTAPAVVPMTRQQAANIVQGRVWVGDEATLGQLQAPQTISSATATRRRRGNFYCTAENTLCTYVSDMVPYSAP